MSMKYLGEYFDIHSGGVDHIPVHHPNEIAEAECVTGKHLAKYWIHGGFLNFSGDKMSKSIGNIVRLVDLEENVAPLAVRYNTYTVSYRKTADFSLDSLKASQVALNNLYQFIQRLLKLNQLVASKKIEVQDNQEALNNFKESFFKAVNNDFDMPSSLEVIWNFIKEYNKNPMLYFPQSVLNMFYEFEKVLGLKLDTVTLDSIPVEIEKLAEER
jgi:cysteinyl-tRNA synthetase